MARVTLTSGLSQLYANGVLEHEIEARNAGQLIRALEAQFPGIGAVIEQEMSLAIDNEIYPDPYLEPLNENSEVFVLPKIGGG